jgi:hypothetical protein
VEILCRYDEHHQGVGKKKAPKWELNYTFNNFLNLLKYLFYQLF